MMKQLFSDNELDRWFEIFEDQAETALYKKLQEAGEYFVKMARDSGTYDNQTNNLRSSIGYVIVKDGSTLNSNFQKAGAGTKGDGSKGIERGKKLAATIASQYKGFVLIGVAGMDYAIHVETKGLEVISSSALQTEVWLKKSIQTIFKLAV